MKLVFCVLTLMLSIFAGSAGAAGTDYPDRPIKLIVPWSAGGSVDLSARIVAEPLSKILGQTVIVENKPGAGGSIGANFVAKARPDGYTLLAGSSGSVTANQAVYANVPYDSVKDFAPISMVNVTPMVVEVYPSFPAKTIQDLLDLARKEPDKISMASAGVGSSNHLAIELLQTMAHVKFLHVPYKGSGAALNQLLGGYVKTMIDQITSSISYIHSGKLRALAVTSLQRSPVLPDVPTLDESGLKGYEAASFTGILAPATTPKPIIDKLYAAVIKAASSPKVVERYKKMGAIPKTTTPEQFAAYIKKDIAKWHKVAQAAHIQLRY